MVDIFFIHHHRENFLVLSTDDLFFIWPIIAILYGTVELFTKSSELEKSMDSPSRTIYDLL